MNKVIPNDTKRNDLFEKRYSDFITSVNSRDTDNTFYFSVEHNDPFWIFLKPKVIESEYRLLFEIIIPRCEKENNCIIKCIGERTADFRIVYDLQYIELDNVKDHRALSGSSEIIKY